MPKAIGILTSGGDTPGLNAAIRGISKSLLYESETEIIGFKDGFRGLMENRIIRLDSKMLSGILSLGGTLLGTSRDKPHRMPVGDKILDMTDVILHNYQKHHLDALVCIGGGGTQKNAMKLVEKGMNVITLPKTIDNDVVMTDVTFGFDTALGIATDAIDRLHTTAHSHHRIIVVEIMGNKVGWLALGAGISGGADVILIPEIPYDVSVISEAILKRSRSGKNFSIVAVAEGAISKDAQKDEKKKDDDDTRQESGTLSLAKKLEQLTGLESRVTILGHLQRGGTPSARDRILATQLGVACSHYIRQKKFGKMVAVQGELTTTVSLDKVAGKRKYVPLDHPWVDSARRVGTCLGDI
ncbi:MAG: 6-phosphofructokinase [Calditrichae bacterium]|nr:6-phosphofructokinase [Calditrichota bacterium]MCB9057444.1 6-phosphofructokinase [Calditrichia bacterium]